MELTNHCIDDRRRRSSRASQPLAGFPCHRGVRCL